MPRLASDRGQAAPLAVLLVLVAGGTVLLLAPLGRATLDRARAQTAADAAALAGAAEGPAAARDLVERNGGHLLTTAEDGTGMTVTVQVGGAVVSARAEREPTRPGGGGGDRAGLAPAMLAAIDRVEQLLGEPLPITSGFRSRADQQRLWDARHTNPYPVAPPGTSRHESGYAVDVPRAFVGRLRAVGPNAGLCSPLPTTDPVHFELCPWRPR